MAPAFKSRKTYKKEDGNVDDQSYPAAPQPPLPTESERRVQMARVISEMREHRKTSKDEDDSFDDKLYAAAPPFPREEIPASRYRKTYKDEDVATMINPIQAASKYRKTDRSEDVSVDDRSSPAAPQPAQPPQSQRRGLMARPMIRLILMLGKLFITLAPYLFMALVCFFIFNIYCSTVESVCKIPIISFLSQCQHNDDGRRSLNALMDVQSQLASVQHLSANGNTLPMQLELSKNVVREVAVIVQHTNLPSRDKIVGHMNEFWQLTDVTGEEIGDFLQGIDRMVDSVITRNELTLRNLKRIAISRSESRSIASQVAAVLFHTPLTAEDAARKQYLQHLDSLTSDIDSLILEAQILDLNLKNMANLQWDIRRLIVGDRAEVAQNYNEVQSRFWTWFGAHQDLLQDYQQQANILEGLDQQQKWAVNMVSEVTQTLRAMKRKLGDLRVRVKEPGFNIGADFELQIAVIEKGAQALITGKAKSRQAKQESIDDIKKQIDAKRKAA